MRNILSKIIILFNVFVGVFCVLMSASVMADYVDQDGIDVIEIVATPWVDTQQTSAPTMTMSGGVSSGEAAARSAAEKAGRIAACKYVKEGMPNDIEDCKAEVDYLQSTVACNENTTSAEKQTFNWSFSYDSGRYFSMVVNLPEQSYYNDFINHTSPCPTLKKASGDLTRSKCQTQGTWIINEVCKGL